MSTPGSNADTVYRVVTRYEVEGEQQAEAKVGALAGRLQGMFHGIAGIGASALDTVARAGVGFATLVGGGAITAALGAVVHGVTGLNAEAESATISIAGMFQAGGGARDFDSAMRMSQETIARMRVDAAALPGEFQDLQNVFQGGLMGGLNAGRNAQEIENLSARLMSVTQMFHIDSQQVGRDFSLMMEGRAGAHVATFSRLRAQIGLSAEAFNQLSYQQRWDRISNALNGFDPAIRRFGSSWAAVSSTFHDNVTNFVRIATAPLFDRARDGLARVNTWLEANHTRVEAIERLVADRLVQGFDTLVERGKQLVGWLRSFTLGDVIREARTLGQEFLGLRVGLGLLSSPGMASGLGTLLGAGGGVGALGVAAIALPLASAIADGAIDVRRVGHELLDAMTPLGRAFMDLGSALRPLGDLIGTGLVTVLVSVTQAISDTVTPVLRFSAALMGAVNWIADHLGIHTEGGLPGGSGGIRTAEQQRDADSGRADFERGAGEAAWSYVRSQMRTGQMVHNALNRGDTDAATLLTEGGRFSVNEHNLTARAEAAFDRAGLNALGFHSMAHGVNPGRSDRARQAAQGRGHQHVHVRIEQTINDASDPDRVLVMTRRAVREAVQHPIESHGVQVLHDG